MVKLGGNAQVSRSGRYVWNQGGWSSFVSLASFNTLLDLQSGTTVQTPITPSNFRQNVTGNGSVLGFTLPSELMLWDPTGSHAIQTVETPTSAIINDAGTFQAPFELTVGQTLSLYLPNASVFGGCPAVQSTVLERQPYFAQSSGNLVLAHQDYQTLVTEASPVQPGEIVHAYAIGLGSVAPAIQTGVPAPLSPLSALSEPFDCFIGTASGGPPINVLFAGLAPGTIGLYQIDLQMPSLLPAQEFILDCGTPNNPLERNGGFVPVPKQPQ